MSHWLSETQLEQPLNAIGTVAAHSIAADTARKFELEKQGRKNESERATTGSTTKGSASSGR